MADEPDDVLDLADAEDVTELPVEEEQDDQHEGEGDAEETVVGFGDVEAAPAPEADSSVIRDLRRADREKARRIRELERQIAPKPIEVGDEPELADFDYDQDLWKPEWVAWTNRKAAAEQQQREAQEQARKTDEEWQQRGVAYKADKAKLALPDFDAAEEVVFDTLSDQHKALLMRSGKGAELVYALHRAPDKLDQLSKLDLADAAMMIGELRGQVQVTKRRLPQPDQAVRGNAPTGATSQDRELARLEKEAARTGDRSAVANFKRQMKRA